ncbi:MAG: hypothetical protein L6R39_007839, partial [Caloplaca ligustica]
HGGRDARCGILGPLIHREFERLHRDINVGMISHVGGHAFAGNVIVYIPPDFAVEGGEKSPLAGMGIWYGRVEPRHVEAILEETIKKGRIIGELWRGGLDVEENEDWRRRTTSARVMRVPPRFLEGDASVAEEKDGGK